MVVTDDSGSGYLSSRGQAAVTKASVTIVFDNSDKTRSPIGFEASKQITVTRQASLIVPARSLPNRSLIMMKRPMTVDCGRGCFQVPVERAQMHATEVAGDFPIGPVEHQQSQLLDHAR